MPVFAMKTLERQLDETLRTERLIAMLSAAFGVLATLLAALGLYGVMAFVVARRTKEIGLRMALGAPQSAVVWMVMRETLALVAIGLVVGVPVAYWLRQLCVDAIVQRAGRRCWTAATAAAHSDGDRFACRIPAGAAGDDY